MKKIKTLINGAVLIMILGIGMVKIGYADVNILPTVAVNGNDDVTITWSYLGWGSIPSIIYKRYDKEGDPIDNVGQPASSSFGSPSFFNYDPEVATDSAGNSVIVWCTYEFSSPGENISIVYTIISSPSETSREAAAPQIMAVSPQQDEEVEINLLNFPFAPVIAIDSEDNMAIAWATYDFKSGANGIYLATGTVTEGMSEAVKVIDNVEEVT